MNTAPGSLEPALAALVGAPQVVSGPACAALAVGGKAPQYLVTPPNAESVAAVLKFAAEHDLGVIPRGNGSKMAWGNRPRRYDLALSLRALNHVWHYEPADLTITVEAGMNLADLEEFLERDGLWLPLDPPGGACASLGGILATNSSGPLRLRFGSARDMVLGIKVATAEGKLIKSGGRVVKNVAGYDLCKLLVGSYGTLGVIVEASFKLFPRPAARATWALEAGSLGLARDIRRHILDSPLEPLRLALFNGAALELMSSEPASAGTPRLELWVEAGGAESILARYARDLAEIGRSMGVPCRPLDAPSAAAAWARLGDYERLFAGSFPEVLLLKAALPLSSSEEFLSFAQQLAEGNAVQMAAFAQVGVGVVHLGLWGQGIAALTERLVTAMRKAAAGLGGVLLAEGYPRGFEAERDAWGQAGDSLEAMRRLKAAWDPRGVLSPGRFVGGI